MNATPRSIEDYLQQLRDALSGADPALIQDALYDAEEYLRAEVAAHPGQTESESLGHIVGAYGTPEEIAAAYRDTESRLSPGLPPAPPRVPSSNPLTRFFGIYLDWRAYTSLFFMLLAIVTGTLYFSFAMTGLSLSLGLSILIIGVPVFLAFVGIARVIALGEGRLVEAISGERMPRRPVHPGPPRGWLARIGDMLADLRTWSTLGYLIAMLPLGIVYFVVAIVGLSVGLGLISVAPAAIGAELGLWKPDTGFVVLDPDHSFWLADWIQTPSGIVMVSLLSALLGVLIITVLLHLARAVGRLHATIAKSLLVKL